MKKIFGLAFVAILVLAMVAGGTWAYFQDSESSENNTLTAGTLNLQVDGGDAAVTTFTMSNIKPGASGSGSTTLTTAGSLDGILFVGSSAAANTEGTPAEFQTGGTGDLGGAVEIAIFIDVDNSGDYTSGDIGLKNDGSTYSTTLDFQSLDSYGGQTWTSSAGGIETLASGSSQQFHVDWRFPETGLDQNVCQGDAVSLDFTFTLKQS